ncbi:hypothetical protein SAMN05421755_10185 [Nitrosomonas sp. Nm33]|nr:hypothetical protein SAMN05421755_10185 [Nitrosomonas sp. Nm33]
MNSGFTHPSSATKSVQYRLMVEAESNRLSVSDSIIDIGGIDSACCGIQSLSCTLQDLMIELSG